MRYRYLKSVSRRINQDASSFLIAFRLFRFAAVSDETPTECQRISTALQTRIRGNRLARQLIRTGEDMRCIRFETRRVIVIFRMETAVRRDETAVNYRPRSIAVQNLLRLTSGSDPNN